MGISMGGRVPVGHLLFLMLLGERESSLVSGRLSECENVRVWCEVREGTEKGRGGGGVGNKMKCKVNYIATVCV